MPLLDLVVAEAVQSFELNIDLFDEVQAISDAGELIPSIIQTESEEVVEIQVNLTESTKLEPAKKQSGYAAASWVGSITVAVAAIAVGATVYQRYYAQKN